MVPSSTPSHSSSGPSSLIPAPPLRPPNAAGPGSSTMSHPGPGSGHPPMSAPYGHNGHMSAHSHNSHSHNQHLSAHHHQQSHPVAGGPNNVNVNGHSSSYPHAASLPSTSPGTRPISASSVSGPGPSMHPSHAHAHGPSPSPFHHPLHSPSGMRQTSHQHPQHPQHHHQPPMQQQPHHQHLHTMHPPHHPNMPPHQPPHHQQYPHYQPPPHPSQHPSHHRDGGHHRGMPQSAPVSSGSSSQQQQQQPQMYLTNSINGNWQSDKDMDHRREMIQNIVQLLKQRDTNSSQEWLNKLPQMVKQLEVSLYRSAPSFDAYSDKSTLKHRLQLLAMEISKKTNHGDDSNSKSNINNNNNNPKRITNAGGDNKNSKQQHPRVEVDLRPGYSKRHGPNGHMNSQVDPRVGIWTEGMQPPWDRPRAMEQGESRPNSSNKQTFVELGKINGMMSSDVIFRGSNNGPPSSTGNSKSSEKEWEVRIRHKQQRLLLLHHSSKCKNTDGNCPVTQHCADMKKLWLHMARCEDNRCRIPHCYSSRAILSHYRKCKDPKCQACTPVRKVVWDDKPGQSDGMRKPPSSSTTSSVPNLNPPLLQPNETASAPIDPKIKHKQQRLLLLRHASKCPAKEGECRKTPHCWEMKKWWKHISECHDKNCKYPHCLSSRYVLMHYRRCKDANCPACAPVRAAPDPYTDKSKPTTVKEEEPGLKRPRTDEPLSPQAPKDQKIKGVVPTVQPTSDLSHSIVNNFTIEQIELHLQSLTQAFILPAKELKEKCLIILKSLQEHEHFWVFSKPVDPVELALADYTKIIKKPMDLGTVQKKIESKEYRSFNDFNIDIQLTFDNAMTYNEPASVVYDMAVSLKQTYERSHEDMLKSLRKEEEDRKKNESACPLCGYQKLLFEPPVFFCNNMKCSSKRIHRNRHFYVGGSNQYNYCVQCYNELDNNTPIEMPDMTLKKDDLKRKKNDEVHEENWVQCDCCDRWIHQICGLFNHRQNKDKTSTYRCPKCVIEERKRGNGPIKGNALTAEDLPRTKLSEWIEDYIGPKVKNQYKLLAKEKSVVEKIPFEEAYKILSNCGKITVRQVTSTDRKIEVRDMMKQHYSHKSYPEEFPYRCKCLLVFQKLDGADVILFALYVYEHGKDTPLPNQRTVYISYLDSVYYMRPRNLRTFVYHEILMAYLEHARRSGFAKAHIWACPPLKGDDYIFYAKPEDQKTPKDKMLTKWYVDMLVEAQKRGIVGKLTNMYDVYFAPGTFDATAVPYLEGDYFSSEIESIIKDLKDGKSAKNASKNKKKKGGEKSKSKSKNNRKGTRSSGLDDCTSGIVLEGSDSSSGNKKDPVMAKLGDRIKDMKQSFIVAYLNWEGARPEDKEVPQDILEERESRKDQKPTKTEKKKRDVDGNIKREEKKDNNNVIDDDTEEISGEIFDTRQDFLNLCKGNHYQFDAPRRAKHTSMMVLWHLHNKNAAKFVQNCMNCSREILSGVRYTCETCTDIDLCADCHSKPNVNRGLCAHQLVCKPVDTESSKNGAGASNLTEAQRRERQRNINLHIKLLEHASLCVSPNCASSNCAKMKQYLKHSKICKAKMGGGCKICKRIWTLLRYHAQSCKHIKCPIPQCRAIRDRMRQIARKQQMMDDRRRQMINRQYQSNHGAS